MDTVDPNDTQFILHTVKETTTYKPREGEKNPSWSMTFQRGYSILGASWPPPEVGQKVRLYGNGFGSIVRGLVVEEPDGSLRTLRYLTEEGQAAENKRLLEKSKREKLERWENQKEGLLEQVAAFRAPFRERIEWFMRNPEWGAEFGGYEIFCCAEAEKIISYIEANMPASKKAAQEMIGKIHEESDLQEEAGLAVKDHSGNTFGMSCRLARIYIEDNSLLPKAHGALCPLVGCKSAGCYAETLPQDAATT